MTEEPRAPVPVSWLRLERYHLGELSPEDAAEVERALATDPETRACLDEIRRPVVLRPLPEPPSVVRSWRGSARQRWAAVSFAVAAAASIALFVGTRGAVDHGVPPRSVHVKGGDVAISLVRERAGAIDTAPSTFAEGDRFKVLITCPPALDGGFDVVVFQDGAASFPFDAPETLACGNDVPFPGAFTVTGADPATVCVTWGRESELRGAVQRSGLAAARGSSVCATLSPE
ncbi:MAG TPA: hypothetical protein VH062_05560 [Polyangiaceae bacterium]|jgi:hypothetical protein|nr:hypothetical protein [Polyangiaceae bacterium]